MPVGPNSVVRQLVTSETYEYLSRDMWRSHTVLQKTNFFSDFAPRPLTNSYRCFKASFSFYFWGPSFLGWWSLKIKALLYCLISLYTQYSTHYSILEDLNFRCKFLIKWVHSVSLVWIAKKFQYMFVLYFLTQTMSFLFWITVRPEDGLCLVGTCNCFDKIFVLDWHIVFLHSTQRDEI